MLTLRWLTFLKNILERISSIGKYTLFEVQVDRQMTNEYDDVILK